LSSRTQTLLRIRLPEGARLYPQEFRELLAKQPGMPHDLFHYDDAGRPRQGMPGVRTVGAHRWAGLLADSEHADLIYQVTGPAVQAVTRRLGANVRLEIEQHDLAIKRRDELRKYFVREMAVKRRRPGARTADVEALVTERLMASLARMATHHGLDCPTAADLGLVVDVEREVGLRLSTTTGPTEEFVTLLNASFWVHADLKGMWFAGNLTARGYGRIGLDLKDLGLNQIASNPQHWSTLR
jgi:hypothetical protein